MSVRATLILAVPLVLVAGAAVLAGTRMRREADVDRTWQDLARPDPAVAEAVFDPGMVEGLPEPARRYLLRSIEPGTALASVAELRMRGSLQLSPDAEPLPMRADQVLHPTAGFVWRARVGHGLMRIRGYDRFNDGEGELRWWLWGLVPVVRGQGSDVDRSAAGRLGGESVLVPSALLPQRGAEWEALDDATALVRIPAGIETVTVTVEVDPEGRLRRATFPRWNGDPANGPVGYLRFGVEMAGEIEAGGYRIPRSLRAGWRPDDPDAFVFFDATLDSVRLR